MAAVKIGVDWGKLHLEAPTHWLELRREAADKLDINASAIERCVYVIRLNGFFCIQYPLGQSPVLYIGRGNFKTRITQHINWINTLCKSMEQVRFSIWFFTPRKQRTIDAYKTVEADLIAGFYDEYGALPMLNKSIPKRKYDYEYDPQNKFRQAFLRGSGTNFRWAVSPMPSEESYAAYKKGKSLTPIWS